MFDYDYSYRLDRMSDQEDDPLLVCDACFGKGKLIDLWGSMHCWTCQGTGTVLLSAWLANAHTYPSHVRDHLLATMPPVYTNGGNHHVR